MDREKNQTKKSTRYDILKWIIIGLAGFVIVILIFSLGMFVGGLKARFSYRWAEQYHKMFAGPRRGFFGDWQILPPPADFIESYGNFGEIIKIKENEFVIIGRGNIEKVILINDKTIIKKGREMIKKENLKVGDWVVIIGLPNEEGKIEAKLVRIFDRGLRGLPVPFK